MKDFVPLLPSLLWIASFWIVAVVFRTDIRKIRTALTQRLEKGGSVKVGPLELGAIKEELTEVKSSVRQQEQKTNEQELVLRKQQEIINKLVTYSLCDQAYRILWGISKYNEYKYHNNDDFRRWMYVLLDGGLIEPVQPGGWLEFNAAAHDRNLVGWAKPTPAGQFLMELRGEPS